MEIEEIEITQMDNCNMKIILLTAFMTLISTTGFAQTKELKEVEAAVEELRVAMIEGNKDALEKIASEELTYGHSGGYVEDKSEFIEKLVTRKSDFVSIELSDQIIRVLDNMAMVRHKLTAATNDNGKPGNVNLHVLSVWKKQQGKWMLVARQAVKLTQ